mgnify:CR=1 FL=1
MELPPQQVEALDSLYDALMKPFHSLPTQKQKVDKLRAVVEAEDAEAYFAPLRLACESQHAPAMEEALDCVQKLIAYGYLRGTASGPASPADGGDGDDAASAASSEGDAPPGGSTMDGIVATICGCDDFDDDGVQLQVIKALLTAVTCLLYTSPSPRDRG